ncbi:MAG TPA: efflux transporter outer membrane subunit [Woeseiaceae bacterium]|nr:efflux transporter outer membrane subunit [Woeseiaceae bacterium]
MRCTRTWCAVCALAGLSACATVGPDYEQPASPLGPDWYQAEVAGLSTSPQEEAAWWKLFGDPELDRFVERALAESNTLEIVGLRVLESRAALGIATGLQYPQTQVAAGGATGVSASESAANTAAGDLDYVQYDLGISATWEIDFWGRYRRGIEAADALYRESLATQDEATVLVAAQVAFAYLAVRTIEDQIRITYDNIASQQRSVEIVDVQFRNGETSELDVLQARTLLLSTQATLPVLQAELAQAQHALAVLVDLPPGGLAAQWIANTSIPDVPEALAIGIPAELLRQRPDVRAAEYRAMAANASVGVAEADLYPSFTLSGSVGLVAAGSTDTTRTGESGVGELFSSDSLTWSAGPAFVWPFLNYGRIRNNVRVQDARLQQALVAWRESVLQAAREVEDALVELNGARQQHELLMETVTVAERATDVALLRFQEGFADYQRVLDAQTALFTQQGRLVGSKGDMAAALVSLYLALGGGWQAHTGPLVPGSTIETMRERTNWGELLDEPAEAE